MAAFYHSLLPIGGCNFYQALAPHPSWMQPPGQYLNCGIDTGTVVPGSRNTRWMFCYLSSTAPLPVAANTPVNINSALQVDNGGGGISGRSVVPIAASNQLGGAWFEISGVNLNTSNP